MSPATLRGASVLSSGLGLALCLFSPPSWAEEQEEQEQDESPQREDELEARIESLEAQLAETRALLEQLLDEQLGSESIDPSPPDDALLEELAQALAEDQAPAATPPPARRPAIQLSIQPEIAFTADFAFAVFSTDEPLMSGGHDPVNTGFHLQQLELAVGAAVDPFFRLDAAIVFGQFGVEIEELYATTLALPARMQVRVGQFLTRFGRFNPTHLHAWSFIDQPFPIGRVMGGEGNRGLGAELSILLPLPWSVEVLASATMANGQSTARSFYGATDLGIDGPQHFQLTTAVKQFFDLGRDASLLWGLSFATGPNATGRANRSELYGTDLTLKVRPVAARGRFELLWSTEVIHRRRQVPDDVLSDWNAFTQLVVRPERFIEFGARYELGTPVRDRAGGVGADDLDPDWVQDRQRIAGQVSFLPSHFSRIRFQGGIDLVPWQDEPTASFLTALELTVGAHGAHAW